MPKKQTFRFIPASETTALKHVADTYPMPSVGLGRPPVSDQLYEGMFKVDKVPAEVYKELDVKRGLRNSDGSGVLVGLTTVSTVHGYNKVDGKVVPDEGDLMYRGYHVADLVSAAQSEDRFGYDQDRIDALYKDLLDITKSRLKFVETLFLFRMTDCYTTPISDYEDHFGLFYAPGDPVNKGKPKPYTETIYKWFYGENADTSGLYWYSTPQEE